MERNVKSFNAEQQTAFAIIMWAVCDDNCDKRIFFPNAPSDCGKTFLIDTLLVTVRGMGKRALAVASSGIAAAELLKGGRTSHSRFKIPIPINESSVCNISLQSQDARLIQMTSMIVWDEVMLSSVHRIDCVDRSLRNIF